MAGNCGERKRDFMASAAISAPLEEVVCFGGEPIDSVGYNIYPDSAWLPQRNNSEVRQVKFPVVYFPCVKFSRKMVGYFNLGGK